jgi:hypothetical protein
MLIILALISALLVFLYYQKTNPPLSTTWKWLLGIARFLFIFLVLLLIISPILHFTRETSQPPVTAIAVDVSESMTQLLEDSKTKKESAQEYLSAIQKFFDTQNKNYQIYQFSNGLNGDTIRTDILLSLDEIQKALQHQNLSDIILISDGLNHNNNNFWVLDQMHVPVSTIVLGSSPTYPDIGISYVITNNPVYLGIETEIKVGLESTHDNKNITLTLWKGEQSLASYEFSDIDKIDEVIISYSPQSLGFQQLKVTVELEKDEEINLSNNEREFILNIVKSRAKINLITSQPNWDATFFYRSLKKNSNFDVRLVEHRKDGYYFENEAIQIGEILTETELLILHNPDRFYFTKDEYQAVKNFVRHGGNIIYLDKIDPELEEILPLTSTRHSGEVKASISLTPDAEDYKSFSVGSTFQETNEIWESLPPIYLHFYNVKKDANLLAQAQLPTNNPAIAFSNYFDGHVLMFALNGDYRWKMWEELKRPWFDEFVNSISNWLINADITKRFLCATDKLQYMVGEPINFSALLFDESMNPIPRQDILLKIKPKSGDKSIIEKYLTEKENKYAATVEDLEAGQYSFEASCVIGSRNLVYQGEFLVEKMPLEQSTTGLNTTFLNFIASKTNGLVIRDIQEIERLAEIERKSEIVKQVEEIELWKQWYIPVLAIFLISFELFVRKRKGLQ